MPACVPGSWKVLAATISDRKHYVGTQIGRNDQVVERYCRPQPSREHPTDSGIPNPLDILVRLAECTEDPRAILEFVADHFGYELVRPGLRQRHLVGSPRELRSLATRLARALEHGEGVERLRELRDELGDVAHLVVAEAESRGEEPGEEETRA